MLITILAALIALLLAFSPSFYPLELNLTFLAYLMTIVGTVLLLLFGFVNSLLLIPIQKLEGNAVPHLMEQFHKNRPWRLNRFFVFLFAFLSYCLAAVFMSVSIPFPHILFAIWIFALGLTLDLVRDSLKIATNFLNPFHSAELFHHEAVKAIQNDNDPHLLSAIDDLSEVALRAVEDSKISLALQTLNAFPPILHTFFAAEKSITRSTADNTIQKQTGVDEASFTVFYILQRLELINSIALDLHLGTICSQIITIMGKIIVNCAQFDLSMVTFPAHVLGKFGLKALQYHFDEVAALASSTLLEVTKTIINENDLTYAELVEPFNTIANNLDAIAQSTFKKNKSVNIKMIIQPLRELKAVFQSEKLANHRDTPALLQNIDRILAEYEALEQVMRTIPPIPTIEEGP